MIDFIQGLLNQDPIRRWTPHQIRNHPFLTGEPFTGPFKPDAVPPFSKNMAKRPLEPVVPEQPPPSMMMAPPLPGPAPIPVMYQEPPPLLAAVPAPPPGNFVSMAPGPVQAPAPTAAAAAAPATASQLFPRRQRARTVGISQVPPQMQAILSDIKAYPVEEHRHTNVPTEVVTSRVMPPPEKQSFRESQDGPEAGSSKVTSQQPPMQLGHRRTRSQGNLAGVLAADSPNLRIQYKRRSAIQHSYIDSSFSTSPSSEDDVSHKKSQPVSEKHTTYGQGDSHIHQVESGSGSGSTSRNNSETTSPDSSLAAALDRKVKIASKVKVRIGSRDSFRMPTDVRRGAALLENSSSNKGLLRGVSAGEAAGGLLMMRTSSAEQGKMSSKSSSSKKRSGTEKSGGMMT